MIKLLKYQLKISTDQLIENQWALRPGGAADQLQRAIGRQDRAPAIKGGVGRAEKNIPLAVRPSHILGRITGC